MNAAEALAAGRLAHYAPVLRYHEHEPYRADSPGVMTNLALDGHGTRLLDRAGDLLAAALPLASVPPLTLDFLTGGAYPTGGHKAAATDHLACAAGSYQADGQAMHKRPDLADRVFGRAVQQAPTGRVWLQYWLFYYYNDKSFAGIGDHEGDWEMVQIGLDASGDPEIATYAQHTGGERRDDWGEVETVDGAPVVYVALGSHASYFNAGRYWLRGRPLCDYAMAGPQVRPQVVRIDEKVPWVAWPGHWGATGKDGGESPTGPARHAQQWKQPDTFHKQAEAKRRIKIGGIFLARRETPAPDHVAARRAGDRLRLDYRFGALAALDRDAPVRLVASVRRPRSADPPVTVSVAVTEPSATLEHPAVLGAGAYEVGVTAYSAADVPSPLVRVTVPARRRAPSGGARAASGVAAAGSGSPLAEPAGAPTAPSRHTTALRLIASAAPGDGGAAARLTTAVAEALGEDATGAPWRVAPLFPATGGAVPERLRRHFAVAGAVPTAGPQPLSALAFELARRLSAAAGMEVQPDLPSSAYAPSLPEAAPGAAARARDEPPPLGWALATLHAAEAWELEPTRGAGVLIGHPDTGFTDDPELDGALDTDHDYDVISGDADAHDPLLRDWWPSVENPGHGTGTASVIAGREAGRITGVASGATLLPIRTVKSVAQVFDGDVARAIDHARRAGAHVISMSLGGEGFGPALEDALAAAVEDGVIVLAAAGNYWPFVVAPARLPDCLAIAATNVGNHPWRFSSSGPEVDLSAPGEQVWVAVARRDHGAIEYSIGAHDGTSFAVAHTAGAAALWLNRHGRDALIERYGAEHLHGAFRAAAVARVQAGAKPWDKRRYGAGILDAAALLRAPLPDAAAVAGAAARAVAAGPEPSAAPPSDRLAAILPELSRAQAQARLARLLGTSRADLDATLAPVAAELHYLLVEHRDLREALAAPPPGGTGARALTAHVGPVGARVSMLSSKELRDRLGVG